MKGGGGGTVIEKKTYERPKDFFGCIEELEQYDAAEDNQATIDPKFMTSKGRIDFFNLGLKTQMISCLFTLLLAPVSMGVINNSIRIFNNAMPLILSKIYAYMLSFGLPFAFALFYVYIGRKYRGKISKVIINKLFAGVTLGGIIKILMSGIIYGYCRFTLLTDENIYLFLKKIYKWKPLISYIHKIEHTLFSLRDILIPSFYLIMISTLIFITLPWLSAIYTTIKSNKEHI